MTTGLTATRHDIDSISMSVVPFILGASAAVAVSRRPLGRGISRKGSAGDTYNYLRLEQYDE